MTPLQLIPIIFGTLAPPSAAGPQSQHLSLSHRRCSEGVNTRGTSIIMVTKHNTHKIITPQSMIKCLPCQNSPAPRLLLLFCSPLVLHLLLLLTGRFTFKQCNNILCKTDVIPYELLFVFKELMVKCDKKKQVYGINPPAFSCCLVFLGALPAASASFFFWLFDFGGMIFLFFSKILKLCKKSGFAERQCSSHLARVELEDTA